MSDGPKLKMAMYGTRHAHAEGVLRVMLASPDVEVTGVFEPDPERRRALSAGGRAPWSAVEWYSRAADFLEDDSIVAVAAEGSNRESLDHAESIVNAGKHLFYDKPAGEDFARFRNIVDAARERALLVQLGYMFRYHDGFERIASWARSGFLGDLFAVRAHMSSWIPPESRAEIAHHRGGIFYDLAGHMIDQIVWLLGRPERVSSFMRSSTANPPGFVDNSLAVFEHGQALAFLDIAAMEARPMARRFEVYGTKGSAIMEPFEPAETLRLCLDEPRDGFPAGASILKLEDRPRYVAGLAAFVKDVRREKTPDRSLDHELHVQETLLRATGSLPG